MNKISQFFKSDKAKYFLIIVFAMGITLIFFPTQNNDKNQVMTFSTSNEMSEYSNFLEEGLEKSVSQMINDENVGVFITLESSFESVYASDASVNEAITQEKTDKKSEKQLVLIGASNQLEPVVVKKIPPKIKGVVIVCKKNISKDTIEKITNLAATALNISQTKIYVTGGD